MNEGPPLYIIFLVIFINLYVSLKVAEFIFNVYLLPPEDITVIWRDSIVLG